jgi:hypothetical protein
LKVGENADTIDRDAAANKVVMRKNDFILLFQAIILYGEVIVAIFCEYGANNSASNDAVKQHRAIASAPNVYSSC